MPPPDARGGRSGRGPVPPAAWLIAIAADLVQLVGFPLFVEGIGSPLNDALDVLVSAVLFWMLGWHVALLPALAAELIPVVDIAPTWTLAVAVVALGRRGTAGSVASPPAAAPTGSGAEVVEEAPPALPRAGAAPRD